MIIKDVDESTVVEKSEEHHDLIITGKIGELSQADGSATICHGDGSSATVAVYGPGDTRATKELLDRAAIEVIFSSLGAPSGCAEKYIQDIITKGCEAAIETKNYPRTVISIAVQVLHGSKHSSLLACCLNSAILALLDAGVDMKYLLGAVSCSVMSDGEIIIDTGNAIDEKHGEVVATLTTAFENKNSECVTCISEGLLNLEQLDKCFEKCSNASKILFDFYRESMHRKLSKIT